MKIMQLQLLRETCKFILEEKVIAELFRDTLTINDGFYLPIFTFVKKEKIYYSVLTSETFFVQNVL